MDEHLDGGNVPADSAPPGTDLVAAPDDAILVPVPDADDGTFVVIAEAWNAEAFPLDRAMMLSDAAKGDLTHSLVEATGLVNIGLQGLNGLQSVQGLVRLAPETLKLMQAGATPLTSGGANLGTLAANGKIVAQIRWAPAAGAGAVGVLAALGPAIALAAIQFQLAAMSKKLDQIIEASDEILRAIRVDYWTEVETSVARLRDLWGHAIHQGQVSGHLMEEARGRYWTLSHRRAQLHEDVAARMGELDRLHKAGDRHKWLAKNTAVLMRDLQCLVLSAAGCQMYDLMWAQHVSQTDPALAERIVETARETAAADRRVISETLTSLTRRLELLAVQPGSERIHMFGRDREPEKVLVAARRLGSAAAELGMPTEEPADGKATVQALNSGTKGWNAGRAALSVMRWHLVAGEVLNQVWVGNRSYLCLTDRRVFACGKKSLAEVEWSEIWSDIRGVKSVEVWGDYNLEVKAVSGRRHRFEIFDGEKEKETAKAQAYRLERIALVKTGAPGWSEIGD